MSCEQNVAKTLIKDTEGHFLRIEIMRTTPKGKHEKRLPFLGLSGKKHELERQQAEFFRILCGKHEIVRLRTENHSTESDFSFGADMKTHIRKSKPRVASRPFYRLFFCAWQNYLPLSGRQGHHNILYLKSPIRLTPNGAPCGRTHCRTHPNDRHDHIFSFFFESGKSRENRSKSSKACPAPHTRDSHGFRI